MTDPNDTDDGYRDDSERERWEQEAGWLAADPAYNEWLDELDKLNEQLPEQPEHANYCD